MKKGVARRNVFVILCMTFALGCGPLWMIPGGALSGTVQPHPDDWSFSDAVDTVQLETNVQDPYSVNIWGVRAGPNFYVAAGDKTSTWAQNALRDPDVRLKIADALFELRAVAVDDEAELESALDALRVKYDFEPKPEQREQAMLFRLDAR